MYFSFVIKQIAYLFEDCMQYSVDIWVRCKSKDEVIIFISSGVDPGIFFRWDYTFILS